MLDGLISRDLLGPLALLVVLGLWMLGAHNRITALRGAVLSAWVPVEAALQQRAQALSALLALADQPLASERAAVDAVHAAQAQVALHADAVRRRPAQRDGVVELSKADAVLAATLPRLLALVDQQAMLRGEPAVKAALAALDEARPRLLFARQAFNAAGEAYNQAIVQFPTRLLGPVFRFGQAGTL
jgi:LemA protein